MAYTKYSLTPANNNATPPDGAPEGMLPSAVNDTMRDMMAQIRDCGDGIRDGTYTMTAPKITGGSITGVALSGNTFTNPVITGGSINNTPIGASTANTGAFTTLSASGVATFSAGTVSAPAITTTGDTNTGIFFPAADTIAFTEGGAEAMRIDSSGNVGIGTTSPSLPLQITAGNKSGFNISYDNSGALRTGLFMWTAGGSDGGIGGGVEQTSDNVFTARSTVASYIKFNNGETRFFNNGSLTAGNTYTPTERMRITSGGDVGIGTSSPVSIAGYTIQTLNNGTSGSGTYYQQAATSIGRVLVTSSEMYVGTNGAYPLLFQTNATERMRITSDGDLLVGKTSANTSSGTGVEIRAAGTVAVVAPSTLGDTYDYYNSTAGAFRFYVTNAGVINATSTTITAISDVRLKENIQDIDVGLDKVMALKPRKFDWKSGKGKDIKGDRGWIAQEFEQVFPEMISSWKDPAPEGEEPYKAVNADLIPVLVKAIQEQQAMIEELKQEVAALKANH